MTEFGHPAIFVPDAGLGSYDALKGALKWTLERENRRRLWHTKKEADNSEIRP